MRTTRCAPHVVMRSCFLIGLSRKCIATPFQRDACMPKRWPSFSYTLPVIVTILAGGIFAWDLLTPLGWILWLLSVATLRLTLWMPQRRASLMAASVFTLLIVCGGIFSPRGAPVERALFNRSLARIIHDRFYCNRRYAVATSLAAGFPRPSGRARPARPQRTVSSTPRSRRAPRARLAWHLGGFVTNRHE